MSTPSEDREHSIILYDGLCGLCDRLNRFVLKRDRCARFRYASLQSEFAREILVRHHRSVTDLDTLYVVHRSPGGGERLLSRSRAVVFVLSQLEGIWRWTAVVKILPAALLDVAYGVVAKNRYRIFGRYDSCPLPESKYKDRFIEI